MAMGGNTPRGQQAPQEQQAPLPTPQEIMEYYGRGGLAQPTAEMRAAPGDLPTGQEIMERYRAGVSVPRPGQAPGFGGHPYARQIRQSYMQRQAAKEMRPLVKEGEIVLATGAEPMGAPGLDAKTRFLMGLAENYEERLAAFSKRYPEGDMMLATREAGDAVAVFRTEPGKPWRVVDPFAAEPGGFELREIGRDLADLSGLIGPVAGEVAVVAGTRGLSFARAAMRLFFGAGSGKTLEELWEIDLGQQRQTLTEVAQDVAMEGAAAVAGAGVGAAVGRAVNVGRGAGVVTPSKAGRAAEIAAKRRGLPAPMPHQMSVNPIVRRLGGQAAATVPSIEIYHLAQQEATAIAARRMREFSPDGLVHGLGRFIEDQERLIRSSLVHEFRTGSVTKAGTAAREGINKWDTLKQAEISDAYRAARGLDEPEYDPQSLLDTIRDLERGVPVYTGATEAGEATFAQAQPTGREMQAVMDFLKRIDFSQTRVQMPNGDVADLTDALRAQRELLFDLKTPPPGDIRRRPHHQAARLYAAITDVVENPTNMGPEFKEAWRKASGLAKERFEIHEMDFVRRLMRADDPGRVVDNLFVPRGAENLGRLKELLPRRSWDQLKEDFVGKLMETRRFSDVAKTFDKETLETIFEPGELNLYKSVSKQMDDLDASPIREIIKSQDKNVQVLDQMLKDMTPQQVSKFYGQIVGTKLHTSIRSGIIDHTIRQLLKKGERGVTILDPDAANKALKILRDKGYTKFLKKSDLRFIKDLETYARITKKTADSGTSLHAATVIAGLKDFSLSAFLTVAQEMGVGRFYTSGKAASFLAGGKVLKPIEKLRLLGANLGTMTNAMAQDLKELETQ